MLFKNIHLYMGQVLKKLLNTKYLINYIEYYVKLLSHPNYPSLDIIDFSN